MKTKRLWHWIGGVAFCLIIWGLFGHFVCRIGYSTQKPVNWDKPKSDTCKPIKWDVDYNYIDNDLDTLSEYRGNSSETDSIAPCVVSRTWHKNIYWQPIYNHSELKPLNNAD